MKQSLDVIKEKKKRMRPRIARRIAFAASATALGVVAGEVAYVRMTFKLPPSPSGPTADLEKAAVPTQAKKAHNIVFIGDSTARGVGCSEENGKHGPMMPRSCASFIAERLGKDVGWHALSTVGADVPAVCSKHLPEFESLVRRLNADGECVDAVVLLTGLNDVKACFLPADLHFDSRATLPLARHPWRFGEDLETLLHRIRHVAGDQCTILVPEEPMADNPRFSSLWPLSSAMRMVSSLWDGQKRQACIRAAEAMKNTAGQAAFRADKERVPGAPVHAPVKHVPMPRVLGPTCYCIDGMHPSDSGYKAWGEVLACVLLGDHMEEETSFIPELGQRIPVLATPL